MISIPTLLSNLGGTMGMWLGLSVLSLVGLLEKVSNWVWDRYHTKQEQKQKLFHDNGNKNSVDPNL